MSHLIRNTPIRSTARAAAAPRANTAQPALATLILSISVLLLSGAAWMQLT